MTAFELMHDLRSRGVTLAANGDRLRITAPHGTVTGALRDLITAQKSELLELLSQESSESALPHRPASGFRFVSDVLAFGDVCAGWTPASWADELRRKAACCDAYRPDIAAYYRAWAADIDRRLKHGQQRRTGASS